MIFKSIAFKNLLSFGAKEVTVPLDTNSLTLIKGKNGAGKSTIMEALYFAISGKPMRKIKKGQLVNTKNKKNLEVRLKVLQGKNEIEIIRGIAPNKFEIYLNDAKIDEDSNIGDYQGYLEKLLQMNPWIFQKTVVMSTKNYIPFLQMTTGEKRNFIEEILGIKIYSVMLKVLKTKVSLIETELRDLEKDISHHNHTIEMINEANEKANTQNDELIQEHLDSIKEHEKSLKKYQNEYALVVEELNKIKKTISEYETQNEDIQKEITSLDLEYTNLENIGLEQITSEIHYIKDKLIDELKEKLSDETVVKIEISNAKRTLKECKEKYEFYKTNDTCPECEQPMDKNFVKKIIENLKTEGNVASKILKDNEKLLEENIKINTKINKTNDYFIQVTKDVFQNDVSLDKIDFFKKYPDIKKACKAYLDDVIRINKEIKKLKTQSISLKDQMTNIQKEKEEIEIKKSDIYTNAQVSETSIKQSNKSINSLKEKGKEKLQSTKPIEKLIKEANIKTKQNELDKEHLLILKKILADDGIKRFILKRYMPIFNNYVNQYLDLLGANYRITFDEAIDVKIIANGYEDLQYTSFSAGETERLDLAILFAFLDLAKHKNSVQTNLLFLDEVLDSSLDEEGFEGVFSIFEHLKQKGFTVNVISHKKDIDSRFDDVISLNKKNKFSSLEI